MATVYTSTTADYTRGSTDTCIGCDFNNTDNTGTTSVINDGRAYKTILVIKNTNRSFNSKAIIKPKIHIPTPILIIKIKPQKLNRSPYKTWLKHPTRCRSPPISLYYHPNL